MTPGELQTLGQFLLLQNALHIATNPRQMGELVCATLSEVPGIHSVAIYLDQTKVAQTYGTDDSLFDWPHTAQVNDSFLTDESNSISIVRIEKGRNTFGFIAYVCGLSIDCQPYRPHIENTAHIFALLLQNKEQSALIEATNRNLEDQVAERFRSLQQSENRLRLAQKAAKCGLWDWDIKKDIVFFSREYFTLAGYEPDAFPHSYNEWRLRVHPDDLEETEQSIKDYLTGKAPNFSVEFRFKTSDGGWVWLLSQGEITERDSEGNPLHICGLHIDISDKKKFEQRLIANEYKYRTLLDNQNDAIFVHKLEQKGYSTFTEVNREAVERYGYSQEELYQMTPADLSSAAIQPPSPEHPMSKLRESGQAIFESIHVSKSGEQIPVEVSAQLIDLDNEKYILASARDLRERLKAREALHRVIQEWQTAMDAFEDIIYLLDNDRCLVRANKAFYKVLNVTPEEAKGQLISQIMHPDGDDMTRDVCRAQIEKYDLVTVQEPSDPNNPTGKPIEISVKIIRDEQDRSTGILMTLHDLTHTRQIEQQIRESEIKYRTLADYTYDWEAWISPKGEYIYISPSCERVTGYSREEYIANPGLLFDIIPEEHKNSVATHYEEKNANRDPYHDMIFPIIHKNGEQRWIEHHCTAVFDEKGRYLGRRNNNRDITIRKLAEDKHLELEEQLRQKYKMEAIGIMAGGMAHNFNNNLSIILGNIELSKLNKNDRDAIDRYLDNAKIAVLRSRDLIKQIMLYSRQESQKKEQQNAVEIIDETLKLLSATLPSTIELSADISPLMKDSYIIADASQVQECIINLCNNAMQAMDEKGRIVLKLEIATLTSQQIPAQFNALPGEYIEISISDTGCGMTQDILEKIFDLFYTTKPVGQGTGVGLSTVQGIVKEHHGIIKVKSVPDHGSTFSLFFPKSDQADLGPDQPLAEGKNINREARILFVDDDAMISDLGVQILTEVGYDVVSMTDSSAALEFFKDNATDIDLVLTDQTMPGLTGKELIQQIKVIRPETATILCTGYSSQVNEDEAEKIGVDAYLEKPIDFSTLTKVVRNTLQ